jgi:nucleoside-diphosphate-sugar epimerase
METSASGRRVLITGATGFLGARLVQACLARGDAVTGTVRSSTSASHPRLELLQLDLARQEVDRSTVAGHDVVIHAAAVLHATTPNDVELQRRVNVEGTRSLLDACRSSRVPRFVHVSSTATIGPTGDIGSPASEDSAHGPTRLGQTYPETKREAEALVLGANGADFEAVVAIPGFMFGSFEGGFRGAEVVAPLLRRRIVPCLKGGLSIVHVDDVAAGVLQVAEIGEAGERYILSGPNASFREIARAVERLTHRRRIVLEIPDVVRALAALALNSRPARAAGVTPRVYLDPRYAYPYYSSEKARTELGYAYRPLDVIIEEALAFLDKSP